MIFTFLLGVFALCCIGSWASFTDRVRESNYYVSLMAGISVLTGLLFAFGCQTLGTKPKIFMYSLGYDILMAVCYYVLPLLLFGCHLRPGMIVGAVLVVLGLFVIHITGA